MTYYKFLNETGCSTQQGTQWHLPKDGKPGRAMPRVRGPLVPCENGYHLCRERDLVHWLGPVLWEAEPIGDELVEANESETKVVCRSARLLRQVTTWNDRTTRLLAADYAERVLHLFESRHPEDSRPRTAIQAARNYAEGRIDSAALATAGAAARAAARAAALAAAGAATGAAARDAAGTAAWTAAGAAARGAALAAALDAAWIFAGAATRDAAFSAAWAAAGTAAGAAARDAAGDAAWTAEQAWQTVRLMEYVKGERP